MSLSNTMMLRLLLVALVALTCSAFFTFSEHPLRKLIAGSNCIYIERGIIPPYYKCLGCQFEEAAACVHDIRHNLSWNVDQNCKMLKIQETPSTDCCPRLYFDARQRRHELEYTTAAYPMAFTCMERAGCKNELIYRELDEECSSLCTDTDVRLPTFGRPMCHAPFNAAPSEWFNSRTGPLSSSILSFSGLLSLISFACTHGYVLGAVVVVSLSVIGMS